MSATAKHHCADHALSSGEPRRLAEWQRTFVVLALAGAVAPCVTLGAAVLRAEPFWPTPRVLTAAFLFVGIASAAVAAPPTLSRPGRTVGGEGIGWLTQALAVLLVATGTTLLGAALLMLPANLAPQSAMAGVLALGIAWASQKHPREPVPTHAHPCGESPAAACSVRIRCVQPTETDKHQSSDRADRRPCARIIRFIGARRSCTHVLNLPAD